MGNPLSLWQMRIDQGQMQYDKEQAEAMRALDQLWHELTESFHHDKKSDIFSLLLRFLNYQQPIPPKGLYIYGAVGRGKSMLMDMFYTSLKRKDKRRVHFHEFLLEIHEKLNEWRAKSTLSARRDPLTNIAREIAKNTKILCFDEFHIKDIADAMILSRLFSALFDQGLVVIATSNQAPDGLYQEGLQREHILPFIALIKQKNHVIHLDASQDYRLKMNEEDKSITPRKKDSLFFALAQNCLEAKPEMAKKWIDEHLAAQPSTQFQLNHGGRKITIGRIYKDENGHKTLRASFNEVCAQALGAVDYLALSKSVNAVIIEEIPYLEQERKYQAKRFITLIDILYDQKILLLVNLPVKIHELCVINPLKAEFERTSSRLYEMIYHQNWQLK